MQLAFLCFLRICVGLLFCLKYSRAFTWLSPLWNNLCPQGPLVGVKTMIQCWGKIGNAVKTAL
jgi:hypothetical protein